MPSEPAQSHRGSFIVRIWCEHPSDSPQPGEWRGWIQHVRNGNQIYFISLLDLNSFIEQELGLDMLPDQERQGLV